MKIYTGYFAKIKQYREKGLVTISIARFNKYYSGVSLKLLAPTAEMIYEPESFYIPKYKLILSKLNPSLILKEIEILSGGKDCILLCYEKSGDFCHRRLVAKWIEENTGQEVEEFELKKYD
jgi:uncharacterized protein (DUF488 family)